VWSREGWNGMKFNDGKIPKRLREQIDNLQREISPELAPLMCSAMAIRDKVLQDSDSRIEDSMLIYEIDEYDRLTERTMNFSVNGIVAKAELDTVNGDVWVVYKARDSDLERKLYSFIGVICQEEGRCLYEILSAYENLGLTFLDCFESEGFGNFVMGYNGEKVAGEIRIPLVISAPACFSFLAPFRE